MIPSVRLYQHCLAFPLSVAPPGSRAQAKWPSSFANGSLPIRGMHLVPAQGDRATVEPNRVIFLPLEDILTDITSPIEEIPRR